MKKFILSMAIAAVALVGCDVKDNTPTVFQYPEYAYVVNVSPKTKPAGLVAFEVTYLDANGQTQSKKITESWEYVVPAKKGFVMKMTTKIVLAPNATLPTSGTVDYFISEGISGATGGKSNANFFAITGEGYPNTSYTNFKKMIDEAAVRTYEYEIKPTLEPGM